MRVRSLRPGAEGSMSAENASGQAVRAAPVFRVTRDARDRNDRRGFRTSVSDINGVMLG